MNELEMLIDILEVSVTKNGEIPLTNRHLLNIMKMAQRNLNECDEDEIDIRF